MSTISVDSNTMNDKSLAQVEIHTLDSSSTPPAVDIESREKGAPLNKLAGEYDENSGLRRGLKTRHIALIAIGGIIGPGTIAGLGIFLNSGGPASLLISYIIIGTIAFALMQSLAEMYSMFPLTMAEISTRFVSKYFAATQSYFYLIIWLAILCNEYNTLSATLRFWGPQVPLYGYFLILWCFFMALQFLGSVGWGETEYWFALGKVLGLTAYYIFTIIYMSGGVKGTPAFGFKNFSHPFADNSPIRSLATVFTQISTAYIGIEMVCVSAAETKNPPKAIPMAMRQTVTRIVYVYLGVALSYGISCPYNSPKFDLNQGALKSPMTVALQNAGWEGSKHLINAFIIFVGISAINSCNYIGSRVIKSLSHEGIFPCSKFFERTNKWGVPYNASILFNLFGFISLLNLKTGPAKAYEYIVNISGICSFFVWGTLSYTHIRFRKGWMKAGKSLDDLPYKSWGFPYVEIYSLIMNVFLGLVQGYVYFKPFDLSWFIDCYIMLPIFVIMLLGFRYFLHDHLVPYDQMDFETGRRKDLEEVQEEIKKSKHEERAKYENWFQYKAATVKESFDSFTSKAMALFSH